MNCTLAFSANSTNHGSSHNNHPSRLPVYVIALAVIIPICILTLLLLVTRYCVTQKRQRSVTLTMRRARRTRRMEALHIDIEYSESDVKPSRCYTNLAIEGSPDDDQTFATMVTEQNDGQTDNSLQEQNNNEYIANMKSNDHVQADEQTNHITPNTLDHMHNHVDKNRIFENDHVNQCDATNEMHRYDHVDEHVNPYDVAKPQPPIRFDFSDTESTTSAENWALVSASEMDFLTRNDIIMMVEGEEGGDEMSTKSIGNETLGNEEDQAPLSDLNVIHDKSLGVDQ